MTPWDLVKRSEHSHQKAVFAWANCAARYGFHIADDPRGYVLAEREKIDPRNVLPVPELSRLFAVHNQGHGDKIRGAQAKAEGVKAGVPDMVLPVPRKIVRTEPPDLGIVTGWYHGLFIELKRAKAKATAAGTESDIQTDWRAYLTSQGYRCVVAVGWQEAVDAIKEYLR